MIEYSLQKDINLSIDSGRSQMLDAEPCRSWRNEKWRTIEKNLCGYIAQSAEEKQERRCMRILFL